MARTIRARIDSRESFAIETPVFKRQADSPESLEFLIRANHPIRANRANRFARITPVSVEPPLTLRQKTLPVLRPFSPVRLIFVLVARHLSIFFLHTEQVRYYRNLGLCYALPPYSKPCVGVTRGGC